MNLILLLAMTMTFALFGCKPQERAVYAEQTNSNHIVEGHEVPAGEFGSEFVVMLYSQSEEGEPLACTGSFIAPHAVVTAAHCVPADGTPPRIFFSAQPFLDKNALPLTLDKVVIHPAYKKGVNDIAVVFFKEELPAAAKILQLAPKPWLVLNHHHIFAFGYGRTEGHEDSGDFSEEIGVLRGLDILTQNLLARIDGFYVNQREGGVCFGDSGGPAVVVDDKGTAVLVGVANAVISSPDIQDFCKYKSIYSDVGFYKTWLNSTLNTSVSSSQN